MIKQRQSNIELLRIVSMIMILGLHVNFYALGPVSLQELNHRPLGATSRMFFEFLCIVAVNVFIFISGWFSINAKIKGFLKFLYQILFFYIGIYLVFVFIGERQISWEGIQECFFAKKQGWFIKAYICLYILSPVLNAFVKHSNERQLRLVLIAFYIFQTIYGWYFVDATKFFAQGYSTLSFIGLYLLARYIKLYAMDKKLFSMKKEKDLIVFLSICVLETLLFVITKQNRLDDIVQILWIYSSPLVIVSALYLLLFFSKLEISNKHINRIALSSFTVYLFHSNPNIMPYYVKTAREIFSTYSSLSCLLLMLLEIIVFYIVATLLDYLRIVSWNALWQKFGKKIEHTFSKKL
ncbi:MAG: acyltransferase [Bacteroidales bacterium]|nr:acyltransferase [Bacteroidales bacterium]